MATESSGERRAAYREAVDTGWNIASKPPPKRKRTQPTLDEKKWATESAVVDFVHWLAQHPTVVDQIEAVAAKLSKDVVDELDRSFDAAHRDERRRALADHFWCDLLAALAHVLVQVQQQIDSIPDDIASGINGARNRHGKRSEIGDSAVKLAVDQSWSLIKDLPFIKAALVAWNLREPLRAIRMLAVIICPCPEDHREVVKYCLHPLTGECVENLTKQRLEQTLPEEWLS